MLAAARGAINRLFASCMVLEGNWEKSISIFMSHPYVSM
jgi:hypothetical protein